MAVVMPSASGRVMVPGCLTTYREMVPCLVTVPGTRARYHRKPLSLGDTLGNEAAYPGRRQAKKGLLNLPILTGLSFSGVSKSPGLQRNSVRKLGPFVVYPHGERLSEMQLAVAFLLPGSCSPAYCRSKGWSGRQIDDVQPHT
jgi:hypothetical protein